MRLASSCWAALLQVVDVTNGLLWERLPPGWLPHQLQVIKEFLSLSSPWYHMGRGLPPENPWGATKGTGRWAGPAPRSLDL